MHKAILFALFFISVCTFPLHADVSAPQQCSTLSAKGVAKPLYKYDHERDLVLNVMVENTPWGGQDRSYELDRDDNAVRVSRFRPEDIVGKSLLDFGCNEGGILFACRKLGAADITGVDLNSWCIEQANRSVASKNIPNARFLVGDIENSVLLTSLPQADTVFLLAVLDTSAFVNKTAVIAKVSKLAKHALYYEGHKFQNSHVPRMYEFLISTDFSRFEYLGKHENRVLFRCGREMINESQIPTGAVTTDKSEQDLLNAKEIYVFTDTPKNPSFSNKCTLIQYVRRGK